MPKKNAPKRQVPAPDSGDERIVEAFKRIEALEDIIAIHTANFTKLGEAYVSLYELHTDLADRLLTNTQA